MKAFLECIPCILKQICHIIEKSEPDSSKQVNMMNHVLTALSSINYLNETAPSITHIAHQILKKDLGIIDLYINEKLVCNSEALKSYSIAEKFVQTAADSLEASTKIAIAGNLIDYGALSRFNIQDMFDDYMHRPFMINDFAIFKKLLEQPQHILYIGDNAGEIVFDKLLVTELLCGGHSVTFAVKSLPVLNDALMQDAIAIGMTDLVPVIESGSITAGTLISEASPQFHKALNTCTLIIAKGQGNFETLSEEPLLLPTFYLLLSKCPHISKSAGIREFDLILIEHSHVSARFNHGRITKPC